MRLTQSLVKTGLGCAGGLWSDLFGGVVAGKSASHDDDHRPVDQFAGVSAIGPYQPDGGKTIGSASHWQPVRTTCPMASTTSRRG
jgi:hypothetical protein